MIFTKTSKLLILLSFSIFFVAAGLFTQPVSAQDPEEVTFASCELPQSITLGIPTWYKYLNGQIDASGRCSPILSADDNQLGDTAQQVNAALPIGLAVLEALLRLSGFVAVVMIFWSGFKFLVSQGNPDSAASARKVAINALIGLVIVIIATGLVSFVGERLAS